MTTWRESREAWTPARIDELREAWALGTKTAVIAYDMGLTIGQVCGKAHRLGLPQRDQSIVHGGLGMEIVRRERAKRDFNREKRDAAARRASKVEERSSRPSLRKPSRLWMLMGYHPRSYPAVTK